MCCYGWAVLQNSLCLFSCFRLAAETLGGWGEFTTPTHQMKEEMVEGKRTNERDEEEGWVHWSPKIRWWRRWWCLLLIATEDLLLACDLRNKKCIWETLAIPYGADSDMCVGYIAEEQQIYNLYFNPKALLTSWLPQNMIKPLSVICLQRCIKI